MTVTNTANREHAKVCVFGAGAVGGVLAAKLGLAGFDISVIMRPASASVVNSRGILFQDSDGKTHAVSVAAFECAEDLGAQNVVFVTLKSRSVAGAAEAIGSLVGPSTVVVPMLNGIPWWYDYYGGQEDFKSIRAVDPGGSIPRRIPLRSTVGGIVYFAASVVALGHVRLVASGPVIVGEPDETESSRCLALNKLLQAAGFESRVTGSIRGEIWKKLWGNIAYNPVSALTRTTFAEINASDALRALVRGMMQEAEAVANGLGVELPGSVEARMQATLRLGAFKSSMLQDVESGRPLEVEAMLGAVLELGARTSIHTPRLETVYALLGAYDASRFPVDTGYGGD